MCDPLPVGAHTRLTELAKPVVMPRLCCLRLTLEKRAPKP